MNLKELCETVHAANAKWWQDVETGAPIKRNKGELLALIHSEISECDDGEHEDLMDDKLPSRKMGEVELVDAMIRIFDYAGGFGHDLYTAGLKFGLSDFQNLNHFYWSATFLPERSTIGGIHCWISKVLELERKGHPSHEVADALVSLLLTIAAYGRGYDLHGAYVDKMSYNAKREDHKHEARKAAGGKQF